MISSRLKLLRKESKKSQSDIASMLNVADSTYASWEQGTREPNISTLNKLSEIYNVTVDFLTGKSDYKNDSERNLRNLYVHGTFTDLTDEQKEEISKFIDYIKNRDKNN